MAGRKPKVSPHLLRNEEKKIVIKKKSQLFFRSLVFLSLRYDLHSSLYGWVGLACYSPTKCHQRCRSRHLQLPDGPHTSNQQLGSRNISKGSSMVYMGSNGTFSSYLQTHICFNKVLAMNNCIQQVLTSLNSIFIPRIVCS